jgi:dimethylamine corrinoid protein
VISTERLLKRFEDAVLTRDQYILKNAFSEVETSGLSTDAILTALTKGLDVARLKLKDHSSSIPEFLLSVDVMKQGLNQLKSLQPAKKNPGHPARVIIGVVEGDVHDLGKNIVAGVLEACGYDVMDLGRDIPAGVFIEEVKKTRAHVLALSTMMSTPLENMREVIAWCRRDFPSAAILVGGAPLDERIAHSFGADGYAESAVTVPEEIQRILRSVKSSHNLSKK